MRATRVSTALVTGCVAALLIAPAALAAPASGSAPAPTPSAARSAHAARTTAPAAHATSSAGAASTSSSSSASTGSPAGAGSSAAAGSAPPCSTDPTATHPVICLPPDSGEDRVGFVPDGQSIEFAAQVVNGGTTPEDAKIVITLPATLRVFPDDPPVRIDDWFPVDSSTDDGTDLHCTQSADFRTVICDPGTLAPGANVLIGIPLYAADDAPAGSKASFSVALQPSGSSSFAPSSVSATVQFLGVSHVTTTLTPDRLNVVVGRSGTVTAALHNAGRSEALQTIGLAVLTPTSGSNPHFLITNSPVDVTDDVGQQSGTSPVLVPGQATRRAQLARQVLSAQWGARAARATSGSHPSPVGFWPVGTIAAGATAHVRVAVRAVRLGSDDLTFGALSLTDPGTCNDDGSMCDEIAHARLTAVAPAAPTTRHQEPLAATGTRTDAAWVRAAVLLVALGVLLVLLGRPVRARHRR